MPPNAHSPRPAWFLAGPTATGKSAVAQFIADQTGAAILSADSMLVYRGMDVCTAKPTPEERGVTRYLGIDLVAPDEPFSTGRWLSDVRRQLASLPPPEPADSTVPGHGIIVAGGTGLYIRALIDGLDAPGAADTSRDRWAKAFADGGTDALRKALAARSPATFASLSESDKSNPRRLSRALEKLDAAGDGQPQPAPSRSAPPLAVLSMPAEMLGERISRRVGQMFADGLLDEAARLKAEFPALSATAAAAIGFAEAYAVLEGTMSRDEAAEAIATRTRHLAKRQRTWFRHQSTPVEIDASSGDIQAIAAATIDAWRATGPLEIRIGDAP